MKTINVFFAVITFSLIVSSCELLENTSDLTVAERLEGRWDVEESTIDFKSTKDAYYVYIDIYEVDQNTIAIDGFLDLDGAVYATISGSTLNLAEQEIDGWLVYGSGNISSNYKTITWQYFVDEGSGTWHPVNAVYTKSDY
jgi:hypothetical protein